MINERVIVSDDDSCFVFMEAPIKKNKGIYLVKAMKTEWMQEDETNEELVQRVCKGKSDGKVCFLKYAYWNEKNHEEMDVIMHLKKENAFRMYYPFIEEIYGDFEGKDSQGNELYGIYAEYLEGRSLRMYISDNIHQVMSKEELQEMFTQMMQLLMGVRYYEKSIHVDPYVHRDLKPANIIILKEDKRAVIIDFDWAHIHDSQDTKEKYEKAGDIIGGTLGYADPRAYKQGTSDIKMDIYALGRVFCYWLCGDDYFDETEKQSYMDEGYEELAYGLELNRLRGQFREEKFWPLLAIIKNMVSSVEERYSSVDFIIKDMKRFLRIFYHNDREKLWKICNNELILGIHEEKQEVQDYQVDVSIMYDGINHMLYFPNYRMYEVMLKQTPVMMIYNLDGKLYYIPYISGLEIVKQVKERREEFEILSGDIFKYDDSEIEIKKV